MYEKYGNWAEMRPYGSVWADIKTGRSPMAQDHFQTPPDPERGYKRPKKSKKSLKVRAKPAKACQAVGKFARNLCCNLC